MVQREKAAGGYRAGDLIQSPLHGFIDIAFKMMARLRAIFRIKLHKVISLTEKLKRFIFGLLVDQMIETAREAMVRDLCRREHVNSVNAAFKGPWITHLAA